jgi:hypothetical protein
VSPLLVFEDALEQTARYANVERVASAGNNVGAINPLFHAKNLAQTESIDNRLGELRGVFYA